jgi:hypothetical protein
VVLAMMGALVPANAGDEKAGETKKEPALLLRVSEVKVGAMTSDHRCVLILPGRRYHLERATRQRGRDRVRKVYEGELTAVEWQQLADILAAKDLRELAVPRTRGVLVVEDMDLVTITVWRDPGFQNLEFLTKRERAPYERTLKPLLEWWKDFARRGAPESKAPESDYCALSGNDNMIFAPGM